MSVTVRTLAGEDLRAALDDLARLRIAVFAAYPYLYAGSEAYEREYLAEFTKSEGAVLVAAFDGARIVGVTRVPYTHAFTYDVLPRSSTGAYFAAGALIGSTLTP